MSHSKKFIPSGKLWDTRAKLENEQNEPETYEYQKAKLSQTTTVMYRTPRGQNEEAHIGQSQNHLNINNPDFKKRINQLLYVKFI